MDFNKKLLSVAISSILLSACGGSSGSSSSEVNKDTILPSGPEVTTPEPEQPPETVIPTLTSEQKTALGQAYVPTLLGNLKSISQGADAFMLSSGSAEASVLSSGAEIFEPIRVLSKHIYATREQLASGDSDIELETEYELPTEIGDPKNGNYIWAVEGHYEVSLADNGKVTVSYEASLQNKIKSSGKSIGVERRVNFDISISDGETNDYPKGNWLHQMTIEGSFDFVGERQVTVQGLELKTVVNLDDEAKLLAAAGDHYRGTAFYQMDLSVQKITVLTDGIKTSGALEFLGVMPEKSPQDESIYGFIGSIGDGREPHGDAYRPYAIDFIHNTGAFLPFVRAYLSYPNIRKLEVSNLISERIEDSKLLIQQNSTQLTDKNPDTFTTGYGGPVNNQKIADFVISEDEQSITFSNSLSSVSLSLGEESETENNISCKLSDMNYLAPSESLLTLSVRHLRDCFDRPVTLSEKYQNIESWLLDNELVVGSEAYSHAYPFVNYDGTRLVDSISSTGEVIITVEQDQDFGIDGLHNPWLFDFTSQGKAPDSNGNFLNYDLNWSHQGLFDYTGSVIVDVLGESIELDLAHKDGAVAIHGAVDIDRKAIDVEGTSKVELNIDVTNLVQQVLNNKVANYTNQAVGNIQLDGENVAQLNVISGNFSTDASAEDYTFSLPNPLLCNALMPIMKEFCLDMKSQSFALSIQYSDTTALTEIDGLIDNVENLIYEENCPEGQVIEEGCSVELEKTFHSVTGVIKASELFDVLK